MARHYLDHASTSPARPEATEAMLPWLTGPAAADPGRVHTEGRMARAAIEDAREQVAGLLGARSREVVFTSGATEAINAAVHGATTAAPGRPVVAAQVEHSAVLESSKRRAPVITVPVDGTGGVDVDAVAAALAGPELPALVHCQWGNHEVATVQPVVDVVARCREAGVLVHIDAAQAAGRIPVDFNALDADLMSVSAHKFGGPKGAGALLVRRGLRLESLMAGGEQERARRGGLENVPAIMGFGAACAALAGGRLEAEAAVSAGQSARLLEAATAVDGVTRFGPASPGERLPHIVCVGIDGVEAEPILLGLDQRGVAAHSGSSCSSESLEPSPVLEAMGVEAERSLRLSVGWSTIDADIDAFAAAFAEVVARLRTLAG